MDTAASELNLEALIPDISTIMGLIGFLFFVAVMAGPLLLLGFGLLFRYRPPAEANFSLGYRFWWGMASLEAWRYTQRLAGIIWTILGGALTVIMLVVGIILLCMEPMTMAIGCAVCLVIELVLTAAACITINLIVMKKYDKDGFLREETEK
jgi:hypothetical protein